MELRDSGANLVRVYVYVWISLGSRAPSDRLASAVRYKTRIRGALLSVLSGVHSVIHLFAILDAPEKYDAIPTDCVLRILKELYLLHSQRDGSIEDVLADVNQSREGLLYWYAKKVFCVFEKYLIISEKTQWVSFYFKPWFLAYCNCFFSKVF